MRNLKRAMIIACIAALAALTALTATAQQENIQLTQPSLPKIPESKGIGISYSPDKGIGRIVAADENNKVHQYLEIWEDGKKLPNVVTYLLIGDGQTFSATWGKGPVNPKSFTCKADNIPEFGEKVFWVATVKDGALTFQEIKDGDVKGLFENLAQARRDWGITVSAINQRANANLVQENILGFMKEKNRKKWLDQGWLQPATLCVQHFG